MNNEFSKKSETEATIELQVDSPSELPNEYGIDSSDPVDEAADSNNESNSEYTIEPDHHIDRAKLYSDPDAPIEHSYQQDHQANENIDHSGDSPSNFDSYHRTLDTIDDEDFFNDLNTDFQDLPENHHPPGPPEIEEPFEPAELHIKPAEPQIIEQEPTEEPLPDPLSFDSSNFESAETSYERLSHEPTSDLVKYLNCLDIIFMSKNWFLYFVILTQAYLVYCVLKTFTSLSNEKDARLMQKQILGSKPKGSSTNNNFTFQNNQNKIFNLNNHINHISNESRTWQIEKDNAEANLESLINRLKLANSNLEKSGLPRLLSRNEKLTADLEIIERKTLQVIKERNEVETNIDKITDSQLTLNFEEKTSLFNSLQSKNDKQIEISKNIMKSIQLKTAELEAAKQRLKKADSELDEAQRSFENFLRKNLSTDDGFDLDQVMEKVQNRRLLSQDLEESNKKIEDLNNCQVNMTVREAEKLEEKTLLETKIRQINKDISTVSRRLDEAQIEYEEMENFYKSREDELQSKLGEQASRRQNADGKVQERLNRLKTFDDQLDELKLEHADLKTMYNTNSNTNNRNSSLIERQRAEAASSLRAVERELKEVTAEVDKLKEEELHFRDMVEEAEAVLDGRDPILTRSGGDFAYSTPPPPMPLPPQSVPPMMNGYGGYYEVSPPRPQTAHYAGYQNGAYPMNGQLPLSPREMEQFREESRHSSSEHELRSAIGNP